MIILAPHRVAAISGGPGAEYLLTPDPKEVWAAGAISWSIIDIDLGEEREIDTVFLGYTSASPGALWYIQQSAGWGVGPFVDLCPLQPIRAADSLGPRHHGLIRLPAPVTGRYFRLIPEEVAGVPLQAGVLMLGKAFSAPYELGGGRTVIDTGAKEPLLGGGFGISEGVVKAGLRWTFVGLTPAQRRELWALVYGRGETRPVVVVEETGEPAGLGEEIHYGLFDRFEPYVREAPGETRWALSMTEWV